VILSRKGSAKLVRIPGRSLRDAMPQGSPVRRVIDMPFLRSALLFLLPAALLASGVERGTGILTYRVKLRMQGESAPIETRFSLIPLPVAATANRVKKSRMGAWRLEAQQAKASTFSQAMVLARVERMLFLSGPTSETLPQNLVVHFGEKPCRVWSAKIPSGVHVYAYLVEVAPGLLALSYLSGSFPGGDMASLELQLESFRLDSGVAPAEEGTALLHSLRRLAVASTSSSENGGEQLVQ